MPDEQQLFQEANNAIRAKDKPRARKILQQIIHQSPQSEKAWIYFAFAAETPEQSLNCLKRALEINPNNQKTWEMLRHIEERIPVIENVQNQTPSLKKCFYCAEMIQKTAKVCRFCGRELILIQKKPQPSSGAQTLATISIICGIIGFLVFGIPLGIIALACGIPALSMGAKNGKTGIILGILDITFAIAILICASS